tara:strand:+ start:1106 stop:1624 length:519 start_codon:yes stop_codon:yes gene_type:complete
MQAVAEAIRALTQWFTAGGQVGGITKMFSFTPVITATAYAAGESIGGSIKIQGGHRANGSGVVQSISLINENSLAMIDLTVHFFTKDPLAADTVVFDPTDAILATKIPGAAKLLIADDLTEFDTRDILEKSSLGYPYQIAPSQHLYAVVIASGAITYTSVSGLQLNIGLFLD